MHNHFVELSLVTLTDDFGNFKSFSKMIWPSTNTVNPLTVRVKVSCLNCPRKICQVSNRGCLKAEEL